LELCHSLPLPYNDNREARIFLRAGIEELAVKLTRIGGGITDESLKDSLELYEEIRTILAWIFKRRAQGNPPLTAGDVLIVVQAYFVTPPEEYLGMLKGLMAYLKDAPVSIAKGTPVLISGSVIEDAQAFAIIERLGF
jgi:benzoyl-CoA reductase/2-hydroxyglutaryl-CoA dehydratase subunit BcrC/BadD/HgdB